MPAPTKRTTPRKRPALVPETSPAVEALKAEVLSPNADGSPGTWEWAGETFTINARPDMRVFALYQSGNLARVLPMILGAEGADRLLSIDTDEPFSPEDLAGLIDVWAATVGGVSSGE